MYQNDEALMQGIRDGEVDAGFPVPNNNWYTEDSGIMSTASFLNVPMVIVFTDDYSDAKLNRIAVNGNHVIQEVYQKTYLPDSETVTVNSSEESLEAVQTGAVDATILSSYRAAVMTADRKYSALRTLPLEHGITYSFGILRGETALRALLNRGASLVDSSLAESIVTKYAGGGSNYTMADFLHDHILAVFMGLAVISGIIILLLSAYLRSAHRSRALLDEQAKQLEDALAMAQSANRAKTTFLNNMSHDIRTPMNAIIGFTRLAKESAAGDTQTSDYLDKIEKSSDHLLSLINDVLDMSRIESGKVKLETKAEDIRDILMDIENILSSDVSAKGLDFSVEMKDVTNRGIICDKLRLDQILLNVLSNSVKYTEEGGSVGLYVRELPYDNDAEGAQYSKCEFRIKDNGIGMSSEFLDTIYERFTRVQTSTISGVEGTGLGMAITKALVDMMGGSIDIKSREGEGTEVTLDFVFQMADSTDVTAETNPDGGGIDGEVRLDGKKVLLVEDNLLNLEIATSILEDEGMLVTTAENGQIAVDILKHSNHGDFDFVLMDVQMPVMNGYEAARQIRLLETELADIPIIAMTANAFEEDRRHAIESGMNEHIAKPIDISKLNTVLRKFARS